MLLDRRTLVALALSLAALTASAAPVVYQHNQTDLEFASVHDGTSNTIFFG